MWGTGFFKGLAVTMRNMLRGPITLQYPEQKETLPERARWAVTPKFDEEGKPKCTACEICVRTCPDGILKLDYHKNEDGTKHIDSYRYEVGGCMFCGLCAEACPFDALEMGKDYELAGTDKGCLYRELLHDVPAAGPKRKERPAAVAKPAPASEKPAAEPEAARAAADKPEAAAETPAAKAPETADVPEGGERSA